MEPTIAVIHHSLTKDSGTVSWGAIRKYHTDTNGWKDIGYHYGVELIDNFYEVLVGRPSNVQGAHAVPVNHTSIGICFVGNFDNSTPPDAMLDRAVSVFAPVLKRLQIHPTNIHPHSRYSTKTCPGRMFPMQGFIDAISRKME